MSEESAKRLNEVMKEEKKLDHIEFESKYRVDPTIELALKMAVERLPTFKEFIYAEGADEYFTKSNMFVRYRTENHKGPNARAELTIKIKPEDAKNNIIREEFNVRVDGTPGKTIAKFLGALGFERNFTVVKTCHIYRMEDATLVYYTVADMTDGIIKNTNHFVEIEVSEEKIHNMTESQAWEVLTKYEKLMESFGVNPQKRLRKSLFEMYRR